MANTALTDLTAISSPASGDKLYIVDVSDSTDSIAGSSRSITYANLISGVLSASGITASTTELNYVDGVTSAIQTQLDAKAPLASPTFTGTVTMPVALSGIAKLTSGVLSVVAAPTGTIVGTSDTQELSNKTHDGDFSLKNATDNIKVNSADPKRGLYIDGAAMKARTTSGAASSSTETTTNKVMKTGFAFDKDADEFIQFKIPAPKYWDLGTITAIPHWTADAGTTGTVAWAVQALAVSNDDALDTAFGTAVTSTDTFIATGDLHIGPATTAITVGNTPAKGDMLIFQVYRDVSEDTFDADAILIGLDISFGISQYNDL